MSRLALYLLSAPRLEREGQEITLPRRKALALLAYLAVTGRDHSRDTLATLLWPDDQGRARGNLRSALSLLRQALGEGWLEADRETVGLESAALTGSMSSDIPHARGMHSEGTPSREFWLDVAAFQERLTRQYLCESLRMSLTISGFFPLWVTLPAMALLLADRGDVERAVELYTLASHYPPVHSCWFEDVFERHITAAASTLRPEVIGTARERGRTRDLEATLVELLAELEK